MAEARGVVVKVAKPELVAVPPLDAARHALLGCSKGRRRVVLAAALEEVRLERETASHDEDVRLRSAHAAQRSYGSSASLAQRFEAALAHADAGLATTIQACLRAAIKSDAVIVAFARADLEHFLTSFTSSRFSSQGAAGHGLAQECNAKAYSYGSRIAARVTLARDEFERTQPDRVEAVYRRLKQKPWVGWPLLIGGGLVSAVAAFKAMAPAFLLAWAWIASHAASFGSSR